jgi:protein-tyrosine phosphatase
MFDILKKSEKTEWPFKVDMHSHLLPGIDDGAPDVAASLSLIRNLRQLGYQRFITTPHVYSELYPNTPETIQAAYAVLLSALKEAGEELSITYAAEYFLDDYVSTLLARQQPLLTIYENWVLVEISFVQAPLDLDQRFFDLLLAGYKPILAHPERYSYWHADKAKYHELRERGLLFQVNLLSLGGYYGKQVAETAKYLVKEELVDLVGTDCHHERHIAALRNESRTIIKALDPLIRKDKLLNASL